MTTIFQAAGLGKRFGDFEAVHDVSFSVTRGERVAIIGPNGAGKSTLFNLITGHTKPSSGTVQIFGKDVVGRSPQYVCEMGVGRSFQVSSIFADLSVRENVQVALMARAGLTRRMYGRSWRTLAAEADEVLERVGLRDLGSLSAGALSHGDQRSLELALSISQRPQLLLLDEPTAGMAPEETVKAVELVRRLADEYDLTLMFTEHDMEVVFNTAERVIVMYQGTIIADGEPEIIRDLAVVREVYLGVDA